MLNRFLFHPGSDIKCDHKLQFSHKKITDLGKALSLRLDIHFMHGQVCAIYKAELIKTAGRFFKVTTSTQLVFFT